MGQVRFINSGPAVANGAGTRTTVDIEVGTFAAFLLRISGTTDTGEALAASEVGRIRVIRNGEEIMGAPFQFFYDWTGLKHGFVVATLPTAGVSEIACLIPAGTPQMPNVFDVMSKNEMDIVLEFSADMVTAFGTNAVKWELYGLEAPALAERYQLQVAEQNIQSTAASRRDEVLSFDQIMAIYLRDASDKVDAVLVSTDGKVVVDNIDDDVLAIMTNLENRVEAAQSLREINFTPGGFISETRNRVTKMSPTFNGAGELEVYVMRAVLPAPNFQASQNRLAAYTNRAAGGNVNIPGGLPRGAVRMPR